MFPGLFLFWTPRYCSRILFARIPISGFADPSIGHGCLPWLFYFWSQQRESNPPFQFTELAVYQ